MKKQIIAGAITIVLIGVFKAGLAACGVKYIFFRYEYTDPNAMLYIFLNWLLNLMSIIGLFFIIRFIQMNGDPIYKERLKSRAKKSVPYIIYSLMAIVVLLCIVALVTYL